MIRAFISLATMFTASLAFAKVDRPKQFVLLAFDGSKTNSFWQDSRAFAAENSVRFTYFMNGVYFLLDGDKKLYTEPHLKTHSSAIGWGGTNLGVMKTRLAHVKGAMEEGHEMASHGNAHNNGAGYSAKEWGEEFEQFTELMSGVWERYDAKNEPDYWKEYFANEIIGFRAPQLGVGPGLWSALKTFKFSYDTSRIDKMAYWPTLVENESFWNFPLAGVTIYGENNKPIMIKKNGKLVPKTTISMDYNFYMADSKAVADPDAKNHIKYENQMYNSYMVYFNNNYYGNRAPIHIGHHFSTWNGGAYWKAMQRFAKSVCGLEEVVCGTYKELLAYVEEHKADIPSYQNADFDVVKMPGLLVAPEAIELDEAQLNELRGQANDHFNAHEE